MTKKHKIITLIIIIISTCSCNQKRWNGTQSAHSDTFHSEIPLTKKGKPDYLFRLYNSFLHQLGLENIQNGYDSLHIRIWFSYPKRETKQIVIIKRSRNNWDAEVLTFEAQSSDTLLKDKALLQESRSEVPVNGWEKLVKSLFFENQLNELPDVDKVDGYKDFAFSDGTTYSVEIATKRSYRFYNYPQPEEFVSTYWQARKMNNIVEVIKREFKL